jgi:hypothetical protein
MRIRISLPTGQRLTDAGDDGGCRALRRQLCVPCTIRQLTVAKGGGDLDQRRRARGCRSAPISGYASSRVQF